MEGGDIGLSVPKDIRLPYHPQANTSWKGTKEIEQSDLIYFEEKDPWRIQGLEKSILSWIGGYNSFGQKANS